LKVRRSWDPLNVFSLTMMSIRKNNVHIYPLLECHFQTQIIVRMDYTKDV
jgi:hypothetical protein